MVSDFDSQGGRSEGLGSSNVGKLTSYSTFGSKVCIDVVHQQYFDLPFAADILTPSYLF
jgi:hypothetical protein